MGEEELRGFIWLVTHFLPLMIQAGGRVIQGYPTEARRIRCGKVLHHLQRVYACQRSDHQLKHRWADLITREQDLLDHLGIMIGGTVGGLAPYTVGEVVTFEDPDHSIVYPPPPLKHGHGGFVNGVPSIDATSMLHTPDNLTTLKDANHEHHQRIRLAKRTHFTERLNNNAHYCKELFCIMKERSNPNANVNDVPPSQKLCDDLSTFFHQKIAAVHDSFNTAPPPDPTPTTPPTPAASPPGPK
ncbi:hypothetical protein NDU88_003758 [Pleurodeles waltl]|uniref:Uncharacterized protein n=1 Tax=Pleurodeles waltl TaxID=8319 RepID=A0AAV7PAU0_PLEWA|nr:hypothetical protein NDU88_003758 [Pleurodeles waltl]